MGLAASQARLLFITARQNDVSARMQKISSSNMVLARDEDDVMTKYNQMVNATKLQPLKGDEFSVTYEALMGLTAASNNRISLVTDNNQPISHVVLSATMAGYLGLGTGTVEPNQAKSALAAAGINSGEDIKTKLAGPMQGLNLGSAGGKTDSSSVDWEGIVSRFRQNYGDYPSKQKAIDFKDMAEKMGNISSSDCTGWDASHLGGSHGSSSFNLNLKEVFNGNSGRFVMLAYDGDTSGTPHEQARDNFKRITDVLANKICSYLGMDNNSKLYKVFEDFRDDCAKAIDQWNENDGRINEFINTWETSTGGSADGDNASLSMERLLKTMLSKITEYYNNETLYSKAGKYEGEQSIGGKFNTDYFAVITYNDKGYNIKDWENQLRAEYINAGLGNSDMTWNQALKIAKGLSKQTEKTSASADLVNRADYYNNLYNDLSKRGWIVNTTDDIDDLIQNGTYKVAGRDIHNTELYEEVADEDTRAKAETFYNQEMKKIQRKEKMLDNELTKLNTEYSALTNDYNSVKGILDANIQKSFTYCQTG